MVFNPIFFGGGGRGNSHLNGHFMAFSRTRKSRKNATGPGKFWKSVKLG